MSVRKSLVWAFSGQLLTFAITFGGSVIVARLLSPREMGVYAAAGAISGVISFVTAFGLGAYIIRETDLTEIKIASAFTINALLSVVLAAAIFAVSFWGGDFLGDPGVGW